MKNIVIYFSPTGGTAQVARLIAAQLGVDPIDITVFDCEMNFSPDELVFFCFPVFSGRIPAPLYERMKNISASGTPAVQVAVFGNRAVDDALLEMSDLCKKQGFKTVAGCEMVAPHSIDRRFGAGRPDAADIAKLKRFLEQLAAKSELKELRLPGNYPYRKFDKLPLHPISGKECTGCGTCSSECPTGAIDPEKPQQPDKSKCISCMRCVSVCPFENRKVPKPLMLAASLSLHKLCAGRKEPKFYL